jgi:deoxycytidylate deaminase
MPDSVPTIHLPELFFGFVAPIGASCSATVNEFRTYLLAQGYRVIEIKVTDVFDVAKNYIPPAPPLAKRPSFDRFTTYIAYGNLLREKFGNNCLALAAVRRVMSKRIKLIKDDRFCRTAFLIHQFKRKEEVDLFRSIYGPLFFQVSIYSRRGARVDFLSRDFANTDSSSGPNKYRSLAEELITKDENEVENLHGQRVAKIFHDADFIINLDSSVPIKSQVNRFCELIFSANNVSPTRQEYGLFLAKAAALRTLDLSRQVGAAILSSTGELLALGSNEVPKALGGAYWGNEEFDDRDFVHGEDSNDIRKRQILGELLRIIAPSERLEEILKKPEVKDSQFMDALEYGRVVHAEMCAICDAGRVGHKLKGATLYCTTFPCHMCAKHIVAVGIERVVFLEPYPKSLAYDLHSDSIQIEGGDRGRYNSFPSVSFEHFCGVTPRRFREIFERGRRKNDDGAFEPYIKGIKKPIISIPYPYYQKVEEQITSDAAQRVLMEFFQDER